MYVYMYTPPPSPQEGENQPPAPLQDRDTCSRSPPALTRSGMAKGMLIHIKVSSDDGNTPRAQNAPCACFHIFLAIVSFVLKLFQDVSFQNFARKKEEGGGLGFETIFGKSWAEGQLSLGSFCIKPLSLLIHAVFNSIYIPSLGNAFLQYQIPENDSRKSWKDNVQITFIGTYFWQGLGVVGMVNGHALKNALWFHASRSSKKSWVGEEGCV